MVISLLMILIVFVFNLFFILFYNFTDYKEVDVELLLLSLCSLTTSKKTLFMLLGIM